MRISLVDHVVSGFAKIAIPFWYLPRFSAVLTAILDEVQEVEQAVIDTLSIRDLLQADLPRLTVLGKLVGEPRFGRALEEYRAAVSARIAANYSRSWPSDVNQVWSLLVGATEALGFDQHMLYTLTKQTHPEIHVLEGVSDTTKVSTDGGVTWATGLTLPSGAWYRVVHTLSTLLLVDTDSGDTQRSTDKGITWAAGGGLGVPGSMWGAICAIPGTDVVFAIDTLGTAKRSLDAGISWTTVTATLGTDACTALPSGRVVCVFDGGSQYSDNLGTTWSVGGVHSGVSTGVALLGSRIVSITNAGDILYSDTGGATWVSGGGLGAGSWYLLGAVDGVLYVLDDVTSRLWSSVDGLAWTAGVVLGSGLWMSAFALRSAALTPSLTLTCAGMLRRAMTSGVPVQALWHDGTTVWDDGWGTGTWAATETR